jgi:hypothetical protein
MSNTRELKVDPTVAFTKTVFVPNFRSLSFDDAVSFAAEDAVARAREAGRTPVMVEVTVRVAQ